MTTTDLENGFIGRNLYASTDHCNVIELIIAEVKPSNGDDDLIIASTELRENSKSSSNDIQHDLYFKRVWLNKLDGKPHGTTSVFYDKGAAISHAIRHNQEKIDTLNSRLEDAKNKKEELLKLLKI
ncbi:conserved hypothetical protein [Vibrio chagasii]|nr:conserved hypothetical protein [Vibrio chagasii]